MKVRCGCKPIEPLVATLVEPCVCRGPTGQSPRTWLATSRKVNEATRVRFRRNALAISALVRPPTARSVSEIAKEVVGPEGIVPARDEPQARRA
jgi:hypothetical protein